MKWDLPGGGVSARRPGMRAERGAEEVGVSLTALRPLGRYTGTEVYAKDTVVSYFARAESATLKPRRAEVYEEGWFALGRLPEPLSREAAKIIRQYLAAEGR